MNDQELVLELRQVGLIIAEDIEAGMSDADEAIAQLVKLLDTKNWLTRSIGFGLRVVKNRLIRRLKWWMMRKSKTISANERLRRTETKILNNEAAEGLFDKYAELIRLRKEVSQAEERLKALSSLMRKKELSPNFGDGRAG
jgi:hypothetical protein